MNKKIILIALILFSLCFNLQAQEQGTDSRYTKCDFTHMKLITFKEDVKNKEAQMLVLANKAYLASGLFRHFYEVPYNGFLGFIGKKTEVKTYVIVTDMHGQNQKISTAYLTTDSLLLLKVSSCE